MVHGCLICSKNAYTRYMTMYQISHPKKPLVEYQTTEPVSADSGTHWVSSGADINSDDSMGTWETVSNYTWEQLSDYTWEDINTLKEHLNGK